jgi:hypothetical protein
VMENVVATVPEPAQGISTANRIERPTGEHAPYYMIGEYYFDTMDDLQEAFTSEAGGRLNDDLPNSAGAGFSGSATTRYERIRSHAYHAHPRVFRRVKRPAHQRQRINFPSLSPGALGAGVPQ